MTSVLVLRLRAEARARWRAWLALAAVAGLVAGATVAVLAGARRTETAYPRFLEGTRAFDILTINGGTSPGNANRQFDFDQVARHPLVADSALVSGYIPDGTTPSGRRLGVTDVAVFGSADGRFGRDLNAAHVLRGRLPQAEDEIAASVLAADRFDLDVGDVVHMGLAGAEAYTASQSGGGPPRAPQERFRVVGLMAVQTGIPPVTGGIPPPLLLSPAYTRAHPDGLQVLAVRLRRSTADIPAFAQELHRLAAGEQVVSVTRTELESVVQRSISVQATALRLLAALVGAVALLLLTQAFTRQGVADAEETPTLRALGATGSQLRGFGLARAALIALVAAPVTAVTAVALSPLTPIGVARRVELHPGVEVNAAHLALGGLAVLVLVSSLGTVSAWWAARASRTAGPAGGGGAPSRLAATLARAGFPPPAVSGARLALEHRHGRAAVPVWSTILSVALGLATIAGVMCFATSLRRLFDDPRLYGWNWDVQIGDPFSPTLAGEAERFDDDPAVSAVAVGTISRVRIGPRLVDVLALEGVRGAIEPTVVEGRAPAKVGEIMLGTRTLDELGAELGDMVTVAVGDRAADMRIVGRGVLTEFEGAARLGEGGALTLAGMRSLVPSTVSDVVLLRLRPGPAADDLLRRLAEAPPGNVYLPVKPADLADLERVGGLPSVVAGLLALMALATMTHTLVTSVRRRRRDLAILKVLGFRRRQVAATVAWQSTVVAAVAVAAGLPLGLAAGRWAWRLFADQLGVPPRPVTPPAVAALVPATVLLANAVAALPGMLAARTRPAAELRTE